MNKVLLAFLSGVAHVGGAWVTDEIRRRVGGQFTVDEVAALLGELAPTLTIGERDLLRAALEVDRVRSEGVEG